MVRDLWREIPDLLDHLWREALLLEEKIKEEWSASVVKRHSKLSLAGMAALYSLYSHRGNEYLALKNAYRDARSTSLDERWYLVALRYTPDCWKLTLKSSNGVYAEHYHEVVSFVAPRKKVFEAHGLAILPPLKEYFEYEGDGETDSDTFEGVMIRDDTSETADSKKD